MKTGALNGLESIGDFTTNLSNVKNAYPSVKIKVIDALGNSKIY